MTGDGSSLDLGVAGVQYDALHTVLKELEQRGECIGWHEGEASGIAFEGQAVLARTVAREVDDIWLVVEKGTPNIPGTDCPLGMELEPARKITSSEASFDFTSLLIEPELCCAYWVGCQEEDAKDVVHWLETPIC